ncbi:thiaminase/transcriptional activator TenA [Gibbsiella quercinecans]|uniref:Aminopyrimidine aminohydrolase n=1 Tax=Gibbsiella quercinecans TaxID=929813 RepID=A0A250B7V2_9GAMM|nr:TenA family protein [Gibbsiella quercinecans]ATA22313.1 TenA family transcriptional regulator [Gibbsiella quercinecans]RLM14557.1 TenA family transcriptional regulator [Gibbsiella quercinecans]TCT91037.1 thiaminase/transcriptional activator TenA [Gibbsiella quercinecans]
MASFSERLLHEHQTGWQAMQQHRFVRAIENDDLPAAVFNRYLVYEGDFVATAVAILALGVSHAPDTARQRWLIGGLNELVDTQISWFETVLAKRRINRASYLPAPAGVQHFQQGMLHAARQGGYPDIITLMFGAEWMYYHWCARAAQRPQQDDDLRQWVEMHAAATFFQQANRLKAELDTCAQALDEGEKQRLSSLYGNVLRWEIDFHSAAWE